MSGSELSLLRQSGIFTMRKPLFAAFVFVLIAITGVAQQPAVDHMPPECIRAGQMPVLQAVTNQPGEVRVYFRMVGASDWCYVVANNSLGNYTNAVLPRFENGVEIEYFFVLLKGAQIIARSPQVFHVRASERCDGITARNSLTLAMECSPNSANSIPASLGAGYAVRNAAVIDGSPSAPGQ